MIVFVQRTSADVAYSVLDAPTVIWTSPKASSNTLRILPQV
jgi:hypothetical protein